MIAIEADGAKYPFDTINVGGKFLASANREKSVRSLATYYKRKTGKVFTVSRENSSWVLVERVS